ncbi:MAG: hypothetical protein J6J87_04275 [Oscillospiraceae bacterium]|nr:hypothetical protein [Oscillospiraceae bacterium]
MTATPELEAPERQGSRFWGILGAFLGAVLWSCLSGLLIFLFVGELAQLIMLGNMLLAGWIASWGYRLMRGYRSMKFAQWTVRISIVLAQPLVAVTRLISFALWPFFRSGTPMSWEAVEEIGLRTAEALRERGAVAAIGGMVFLGLIFSRFGWGVLLKYIDPNWYDDPRRLAQLGGGGATFNLAPCWPLPPADDIPERFEVDKGKLIVEGDTITYKVWNKPPRRFAVGNVAGVVLGVSTGYNILYDRENRMLAKFAWSRKNAVLFGQYLLRCGVSFVDTNGSPVDTHPLEEQNIPRQFTVRPEKFYLVIGWAGVVLFGGLLVADIRFLEGIGGWLCGAVFLFFVGLDVWLILAFHNWRLEVDGTQFRYRNIWGKETRFCLEEVAEVKLRALSGIWELRDREGKRLASFDNMIENAGLMIAYLKKYRTERKD